MEVTQHLGELQRQGEALAAAVDAVDLGRPVPTCPDWTVADLVRHVGQVHRWALSYISTGRLEPPGADDEPAMPPGDDDLRAWFRDGHAELTTALRSAPDDLRCWSFLPAPSPRAFWARRQAHETAIHRADAEAAAGVLPSYDPHFAADGIDELLFGFFGRPRGRLVCDPPVTLGLHAVDTEDRWTMTIGPQTRSATKELHDATCVARGAASDLYLLLWNRAATSGVDVSGDARVLDLWRDKAHITWR